jgi:AAA domain
VFVVAYEPNTFAEACRRSDEKLRRERANGKARAPRQFTLFCELEATSTKTWLIHNLLGDGDASVMYGKPGDGKSVLAEDLALHISAGKLWHGRKVKQGAVVFVALERRKLVERRAIAFREQHGLQDLPFAIVGGVYDFRQPRTVDLIAEIVREVENATSQQVVLIVIDTISRALCGGDENSPKDMGAIVTATGRLQTDTSAHVLWVHHMPLEGGDRLRGHGALLGALDTTVHIFKAADGTRTATVVKANDSEEGEGVAFTLNSVAIGEDADGNSTTAPLVVPSERNARSTTPRRNLSPKLELAMRNLTELAAEQGTPPTAAWGLPNGISVVPVELWRKTLQSSGVLNEGDDRRIFWNMKDRLKTKNLIGERDGMIWAV